MHSFQPTLEARVKELREEYASSARKLELAKRGLEQAQHEVTASFARMREAAELLALFAKADNGNTPATPEGTSSNAA